MEINPTREGQIGWSAVHVSAVKAVDESTVQITLVDRKDAFLDKLGTYYTGGFTLHGRLADGLFGPSDYLKTVHSGFADDQAAYDRTVTAAGFENWITYFKSRSNPLVNTEVPVVSPWKMTSPITSELYTWERNPYYWAVDPAGNQLPYIDKISMALIGDTEVLNLRAAAGEIDFQARHIDMSKAPVFLGNAEKSNIEVLFWPAHFTQAGLTFNNSYGEGPVKYDVDQEIKKWIQNKDFRIALSYALDREKVNEVMFLGEGKPKQSTYTKGHPFYPGEEYELKHTELDIAKANQMLDDLGLTKKDSQGFRQRTDGKGVLQFELAYLANYFLPFDKLAELIQEDLAKVGIKVFIKAEDVSVIQERRDANDSVLRASGGGGGNLLTWFDVGGAYRNWYIGQSDVYSAAGVVAEPTDPIILRLGELADQEQRLRLSQLKDNHIESQKIMIDNMFSIGLVGDTPANRGVIVKKKNMKNVPAQGPTEGIQQDPGSSRTVMFFFEGGKNDAE